MTPQILSRRKQNVGKRNATTSPSPDSIIRPFVVGLVIAQTLN